MKNAKLALREVMCSKEETAAGRKQIQAVLDVPKKCGATIASDGFICDKVDGAGSTASDKAQLYWSCT